jgi:hypothetical protein
MSVILPPVYDARPLSAQEENWLEHLHECISPFDDELLLKHLLDHPDPESSENARRLTEYLDYRADARRLAQASSDTYPAPRPSDFLQKILRMKRAVGKVTTTT